MGVGQLSIQNILETYCNNIRLIRQNPAHHPETSLYSAFEALIRDIANILNHDIQVIQQYSQNEIGSPDFGVQFAGGTVSFIEAKAPDTNIDHLTGQERRQFERYIRLPNLIYTNYSDLRLYQNGRLESSAEIIPSQCIDPRQSGISSLLNNHDVEPAINVLRRFFAFAVPSINSPRSLAQNLAQATWLVRDAVREAMEGGDENSPLQQIYNEFRDILFYRLDFPQFADAYAQTLAYGLLLARQQNTQVEITIQNISRSIDSHNHRLLSATLRLLSQDEVVQMVGWTINNLIAIINNVSPNVFSSSSISNDPLLYFYEDFLEIYDPELRKKLGVYYTPSEIVNFQTRVIDHFLVNNFRKRYGFADEGVETLDPAVGTGAYLISALNQGCQRIEQTMGADSIPQAISSMRDHLHGFEILVGPYTVAHFRLSSAIQDRCGQIGNSLPIYLTNTLLPAQEERNTQPHFGFMSAPLNEERIAADRIKNSLPVMVILGNPPYRRTDAEEDKPEWVWNTLLETFREPVRDQHSVDLKNLAELSIWFYRWSIWKLFESDNASGRGILSFISNSSWLLGSAFGGMRQAFRQYFDRIYIIDLHGNKRAPLPANVNEDENVFDIMVGVAISICIADGSRPNQDAEVYYYGNTWGSRADKLSWLNQINNDMSNVRFESIDSNGTSPFFQNLNKLFESWPRLKDDIFVFSKSGVQTKRDSLVVGINRNILEDKIRSFLSAPEQKRSTIFHDTPSRTAAAVANHSFNPNIIIEYSYRPLDKQFLYNDDQFIDRKRPELQRLWGSRNIALTTLSSGHGAGPSVFLHNHLPDICAFRGSFTSHILPLWDNSQEAEYQPHLLSQHNHNINPAIINRLLESYGQNPSPEDIFAYCYATLSAPMYSLEYSQELARSFPRVPFSHDFQIFQEGVGFGSRLIRLHSFEERYPADNSIQIHGTLQSIEFVNYDQNEQRVNIALNAWVSPVTIRAWNYSVSGYDVLRQWLLRRRNLNFDLNLRGELLDLIWIIERTVNLSDGLDDFLSRVIEGGTLTCEN